VADRRRLPPGLSRGGFILGGLAALSLAAPLLATDLPLLARDAGGLHAPALRSALGLPANGDGSGAVALLRAPIPHGPNDLNLPERLSPPSTRHWLGTDSLGRDVAARMLYGGRVSLAVGLLSAFLALALGLPLGALAGYRGGWSDAVVSRAVETVLCFPSLLLVLVILATAPAWVQGLSDVVRISLVLGLTGWIGVARYLRAEFLKLTRSDMVSAARAGGAGGWRIAARHILPCSLAPVLVTTAFAVGGAILLEAALSFLGLGVPPPVATWGGLLNDAQEAIHRAWWLALFPGTALFLAVLACNLVGEGVRELLDPRGTPRKITR